MTKSPLQRLAESLSVGRDGNGARTALVGLLLLAIFATDSLTRPGFAHGMLYVIPILLALLGGRPAPVIVVTVASVIATLAGLGLSPAGTDSLAPLYVYGNRIASALILLAAGALGLLVIEQSRSRSRAESALERSNRMLHLATEIAEVGGWSLQRDDRHLDWTEAVYRIHERDPGAPITLEAGLEHYPPEHRERIRSALERCLSDGTPFDEELQILTSEGRRVWVRALGQPWYGPGDRIIGAHGAFMNIDRSKRTAQRLSSTLQSITDGFMLLDRDWRIGFVNARAEQLLECGHDKIVGRNLWRAFPDMRSSAFETCFRQAADSGETALFEARYPALERWFELRAYPSEDGLAVYFQDVTEQHESRARLKLLQVAIDRINDVVLITEAEPIDPPGPRIVYVNKAFERQTGYGADEVIGRTPRLLQGDKTRREPLDHIREALELGEPVRTELINHRKSGEPFHVEVDIVPIVNATGKPTHFVAVQRDITERVAIEEQSRESQRLESIGQLTGGIAHDFNNLLTVILGNAELLAEALREDDQLGEIARMISAAAGRGSELTDRLLSFARRQTLEPSAVDVKALIEHMRTLLARTLGEHIRIELEFDEADCRAMVDPAQLENALLNLSLNARDAMPDGGTLTLATRSAGFSAAEAERLGLEQGKHLLVEVRDTGEGIEAERIDKVFEPFYTTKEKGKGTGLGLSMVYGFARQSNGQVTIHSRRGEGTSIRLYLPRAGEATETHKAPELDRPARTGSGRILLVEDDELVRDFARDQLQSLGYEVTVAFDGRQALRLIEDEDLTFDLLFTDVVMPGMYGRELAETARKMRPELRILYTSGYSEDSLGDRGRIDPGIRLLGKPYRRKDLAEAVRRTLAED